MERRNQNAILGTAPIPKLILKMAPPTIVAQLVNLLYNIVDRIYIGHIEGIGATALTGVGLCTPILMIVTAFSMLASAGGSARSAIAMGQGNREGAERILGNCLSLLLIFAAALTVLLIAFAEPLLLMFGAREETTLPFALEYMRIYCCGSVFVLLTLGLNPFLNAQGFSTFSMLTTILGAVTNIVLDPIFMFGLNLGVAGAAYATVISQAVSAMFVLWFLTKGKSILKIRLKSMKLQWPVIAPVLGLGVSAFVMVATESILSISFNSSLSDFGGDLSVGAMTIITSCAQLISMPTQGLVQGCLPIISYNFGAHKPDRAKHCFRIILTCAAGYTALFWAVSMLAPQLFVRMFNNDAALVDHTAWAMRIYMAGIFSLGFQTTCQQTFIALSQAKVSLLLACLRKLVLLIPLIFILPLFFQNKVMAVFLAEPISDVIAAAVTVTVFFSRFDRVLNNGPESIGQKH